MNPESKSSRMMNVLSLMALAVEEKISDRSSFMNHLKDILLTDEEYKHFEDCLAACKRVEQPRKKYRDEITREKISAVKDMPIGTSLNLLAASINNKFDPDKGFTCLEKQLDRYQLAYFRNRMSHWEKLSE